ncbi:hypothetical protein [Plantactinospora endophytica]|uniref:LPXTG cell wall anchor domain-containing protein n=1 Tax=Plantactinospora endophytica TaxID=673535 RepID=A0ABQ4EEJ8_9ACTN|nr:hypothetical protein [Plantactinospora endophytica]GIG92671.1 hypothetical protein Pen02_76070 [Plantactinospora endophytica]
MLSASTLALSALAAALFSAPVPAQAHPFGDPQTVAIAADQQRPEVVHVRWKVGGLDDLTLLAVSLGLLPQDRVMLDGAVFYQDSDSAALTASGRFTEYLLRQITVTSAGQPCTGSVQPPADLARSGVTLDYTCSGPAGRVAVTVRTLTDLHPAYRTLASGPNGARAVYESGRESHDWVLGEAAAPAGVPEGPPAAGGPEQQLGRSAAVQLGAVFGGVVLVAVGGLLLFRRSTRRRRAAAEALPSGRSGQPA